MIQYKSLMIQSLMIQYNIIQIQTEPIFLYCIYIGHIPTQPTDPGRHNSIQISLVLYAFWQVRYPACSESTALATRSIFHLFYKQFWEVRVHLQLDRPTTKMLFSPKEFHMFWRNTSNYHGEIDGSVALLSPWKSAMLWNNISNSLHESNVSVSVDFSARHLINHLVNY